MNIAFAMRMEEDPDGGFVVTVPDVPEVITHGNDREEAIRSTQVALAVALFGYLKEGYPIPAARSRGELVSPRVIDVMKIAVVDAWQKSGMSKTDFARKLNVDEKEARRVLDPDKATKADRLEEALGLLGRRVRVDIAKA